MARGGGLALADTVFSAKMVDEGGADCVSINFWKKLWENSLNQIEMEDYNTFHQADYETFFMTEYE